MVKLILKKGKKMSDWIKTKAGLQMAETIIRYLPRITVCLEEIAKRDHTYLVDVKKANEAIKKTAKYKRGKSMIKSIGYRGEE